MELLWLEKLHIDRNRLILQDPKCKTASNKPLMPAARRLVQPHAAHALETRSMLDFLFRHFHLSSPNVETQQPADPNAAGKKEAEKGRVSINLEPYGRVGRAYPPHPHPRSQQLQTEYRTGIPPLEADSSRHNAPLYIPLDQLPQVMDSGPLAKDRSGLLPQFIEAFQVVSTITGVAVAYRKVNKSAMAWHEFDFPMKDLRIKKKANPEQWLTGGFLDARSETEGSIASLVIPPKAIGGLLDRQGVDINSLTIPPDAPGTLYVTDCSGIEGKPYALRAIEAPSATPAMDEAQAEEDDEGTERPLLVKVETLNKRTDSYESVHVMARKGKPLVSDVDLFLLAPLIYKPDIPESPCGSAHADKAFEKSITSDPEWAKKWTLETLMQAATETERGIMRSWEGPIIDFLNRMAEQYGYKGGRPILHGTEMNNPRPTIMNEIFFMLPNTQTLMSSSWLETQAVMHALQEAGHHVALNPAYNKPDENGKVIKCDLAGAAKALAEKHWGKLGAESDARITRRNAVCQGTVPATKTSPKKALTASVLAAWGILEPRQAPKSHKVTIIYDVEKEKKRLQKAFNKEGDKEGELYFWRKYYNRPEPYSEYSEFPDTGAHN